MRTFVVGIWDMQQAFPADCCSLSLPQIAHANVHLRGHFIVMY
jgi:hypothetical protein